MKPILKTYLNEAELTQESKELVSHIAEFQNKWNDAKSKDANEYQLDEIRQKDWDDYIIKNILDAAKKREEGKQLLERGKEDYQREKYRNPSLNLAKQKEIDAAIDGMTTHEANLRAMDYIDGKENMTLYELNRLRAALKKEDAATYNQLSGAMKQRRAGEEHLYFNEKSRKGLAMIKDNETTADGKAKIVFQDGTYQAVDFESLIEW